MSVHRPVKYLSCSIHALSYGNYLPNVCKSTYLFAFLALLWKMIRLQKTPAQLAAFLLALSKQKVIIYLNFFELIAMKCNRVWSARRREWHMS